MAPLYSISVCGGLEKIALEEIQARFHRTGGLKVVERGPKRILFRYSGDAEQLLSLRAAENVFLIIRVFRDMTRSRRSLTTLKKSFRRFDFRPYLEICRNAGVRFRNRITFRVTSRMSTRHNFRRIDLQRAVEEALASCGWYLTNENPALDVWVEIHGDEAHVAIRISPMHMAQRDYKQAHIPASLKPTVAYGLVRLSNPQRDDVFLDAMCGAGTILIERAYSGRYRYLLGGDVLPEAIRAAQQNISRKHRPRQLFLWDSRSLPLAQWSVDKIVCNLPFGEQRNDAEIKSLYRLFLKECGRVLKPTGRMVLLTTQQSTLEYLLKQRESVFKIGQKFRINLLGLKPWVNLCLPY